MLAIIVTLFVLGLTQGREEKLQAGFDTQRLRQPPTGQTFLDSPNGQAAFGQKPFGQTPFGQTPFGQAPFGQPSFGQGPSFGQRPSFGQPPPFRQAPNSPYFEPQNFAESPNNQLRPSRFPNSPFRQAPNNQYFEPQNQFPFDDETNFGAPSLDQPTNAGRRYGRRRFLRRAPFNRPPFADNDDSFQEPQTASYKLCTYTPAAYEKCQNVLKSATDNAITLALACVQQDSRDACIQAVRFRSADMVVLTGHGYQPARRQGLRPAVFARDDADSLYIAVAPRDITLLQLEQAPLNVNQSVHRAFHAAIYFNYRRGHAICPALYNIQNEVAIKIVDSAQYTPTADEILICPDRSHAEYADRQRCNVEAGLERAIFINRQGPKSRFAAIAIKRIFDTILEQFKGTDDSQATENNALATSFNFFNDNVIFKNNTIAFDLQPSYRNGVDEYVFNYLHCNRDNQENHDANQLQ